MLEVHKAERHKAERYKAEVLGRLKLLEVIDGHGHEVIRSSLWSNRQRLDT